MAHYIFCKAHLKNLLLPNLDDRGEMAHSIDGWTPFLDHHFTKYVNNLPSSVKNRARNVSQELSGTYSATVEFFEK